MSIVAAPGERFADVPDYEYPHDRVAVTDDGAEMACVDVPPAGDAEETFVLLHGEPTWGFLYRKSISTLAERGRVVVPDMLGRSDKYTDPDAYGFDLHYGSFETLLFEELDITDVTLVCQDWGGVLGLALAGHHPERFARLVPMNTGVPDGTQEMSDAWHEFAEFFESVEELPVGMLIRTATDQPDTWVEGAMHFLQEDAGEEIAEEIVAFVDRT